MNAPRAPTRDVLALLKLAVNPQLAGIDRHQLAGMSQLLTQQRWNENGLRLAKHSAKPWQPAGDLLVQMVVVPGGKTQEGTHIEAVTPFWQDFIELMNRDPAAMHQLNARQWEEFIAGAYKRAGFDVVILTPRSGDLGRDVIATKKGIGEVRVIDQVKAYKPGHLVTADDVRALLGVVVADGASKGFLTTTSDFAPRLREDILLKPYMPGQLELINGEQLRARLSALAGKN